MDSHTKQLIEIAIAEDLGNGDITTQACFPENHHSRAKIRAKANGVVAGIEVAEYVLQKMAADCKIIAGKKDGDPTQYGNVVLEIEGPSDQILSSERIILNFIQRMSGIATATHMMVQSIAHTKAKLLDTRKTLPGHRFLDKWAVRLGGGENHRMRLDDRYLLKENHIAVAGGIREAIMAIQKHKEANNLQGVLVEVEVPDTAGLISVLAANDEFGKVVDMVMLDNMSVAQMSKAVEINKERVELEASGNVSMESLSAIAETGVDYISSGAITHSVQAMDLSMVII